MDDDEFSIFDDEPEDVPEEEIILGLVTGFPLTPAELTAKYTSPEYASFHTNEEPTYFSDAETGEVVAVMYDRELGKTIEVVIQQGVSNADTND